MPKPPREALLAEKPLTSHPTHEEIEQRAYKLYLKRGDAAGSDVADWLQAESELLEERQSVGKAAAG